MVAMASDTPHTQVLLRKASRIAGRLNSDWYCVYVQTPEESADKIDATVQRKLVDNIQRAQAMGAEVEKLTGADVAEELLTFAHEHGVGVIIVGRSRRSWIHRLTKGSVVSELVNNKYGIDVLIVAETLRVPEAAT
jgi:two-component system sensor histidine kinase KdpD